MDKSQERDFDMKWHTEKRKISELIPYEHNPRQMTEKQVKDLTKSLEKFDLVEIPAIDTDNKIVAGHQRLKILQLLGRGEEEIDVRVPDRKLTEEEFKEYNIRSNKNLGEWNLDELANSFEIDDLLEWGFDERDLKIDLPVEEDDVPEVQAEAVSKLGEIYQLGSHRLMAGDSTKIEDVEKLMDGQKADMVFTDPPYGMDLDTDYTKIMDRGKKYDRVIGDDKEWIFDLANHFDCDEQIWWGGDWYRRTLPAGGSWYVWDKQISEHDGKSHTGSLFELAWSKTPHKREIIKSPYFRFYGMDTKQRLHPTQKPVKLCSWFINELSKESQNVVDLFGGSGSTLIACEQLNRKCFMCEIDEKYVDVILRRWSNLTGKDPIRLNDGKKWSEIVAQSTVM